MIVPAALPLTVNEPLRTEGCPIPPVVALEYLHHERCDHGARGDGQPVHRHIHAAAVTDALGIVIQLLPAPHLRDYVGISLCLQHHGLTVRQARAVS